MYPSLCNTVQPTSCSSFRRDLIASVNELQKVSLFIKDISFNNDANDLAVKRHSHAKSR